MDREKQKGMIEAILFSAGRVVKIRELISLLEINSEEISKVLTEMQKEYQEDNRGIELIRIEDGFTLASKKGYYDVLFPILDKRIKPTLSAASLEVLSIIAYNPRITRPDIDAIRGVDSTASLYRLQEYNLIEQAGKSDLPGKPMTYKVTEEFFKMFGIKNLKELPELPRFRLDSNRQIVIDELEKEDEKVETDKVENTEKEEEKDSNNEE